MTLNTQIKDWFATNAGINDCFVGNGKTYTDADGVTHTGRTGDIVNAFYTAHQVGKDSAIIIANTNYIQLKVINNNIDIDLSDISWTYANDGGIGSSATYCKTVTIPKYKCVNGMCIQDDINGTFLEPTCGNSCITTPVVTTIVMSPSSIQLMKGQGTNLNVIVYDQNNNVMPNVTINWSSSPSNMLIFANMSTSTDLQGISSNYIVTSNTRGTVTVTVTNGAISSNATINIIDSSTGIKTLSKLEITPSITRLNYGEKSEFYVTAYDQNNNPMPDIVIEWTVNPSIATVTNVLTVTLVNGTVNNSITAGNTTGTLILTASSGDKSNNISDNVFINISPGGGLSGTTVATLSSILIGLSLLK